MLSLELKVTLIEIPINICIVDWLSIKVGSNDFAPGLIYTAPTDW